MIDTREELVNALSEAAELEHWPIWTGAKRGSGLALC
jgi:hypothetical protein